MNKIKFFILLLLLFNISKKSDAQTNSANRLTDILIITDDSETSALEIRDDLIQAKYNVNMIVPDLLTQQMLEDHRLVILSTGSNLFPCTNNFMRFLLQNYVDNNGKLIVEGGQTGYVSDIIPEYPSFKSKVMKIDTWVADNGDGIKISEDFINSTLATQPNKLSHSIDINYTGAADMDVCISSEFAETFYETESQKDKVGILAFPNVAAPRVINYFFSYTKITDKSQAKNLINNCVYNLIGKPVGISLISSETPDKYFLNQNYPNPFNPKTVISYEIQVTGFIDLVVYDVLGNVVVNLVSEKQNAGIYSIDFDGSNLSGGVYFYTLTAGDFSDTKKLVLVK